VALLAAKIDAYLDSLTSAAYTFNPPSPIQGAKPTTLHLYLWLDPTRTTGNLAGELRRRLPADTARVEAGETLWAPNLLAMLKGGDFSISPITPERQPVSAKRRTEWK